MMAFLEEKRKEMKSYIYKSLSAIALTCSLGMATSCVGDLDQEPKDPNVTTSATFGEAEIRQALAKCYSVLGVSGQSGPGSSDISGHIHILSLTRLQAVL